MHISVYPFTYQSVMQGLLVFSFREACHPMVDMRPPIKTVLDIRLYFRYILLGYVLVQYYSALNFSTYSVPE